MFPQSYLQAMCYKTYYCSCEEHVLLTFNTGYSVTQHDRFCVQHLNYVLRTHKFGYLLGHGAIIGVCAQIKWITVLPDDTVMGGGGGDAGCVESTRKQLLSPVNHSRRECTHSATDTLKRTHNQMLTAFYPVRATHTPTSLG